IPRVSVSSGDAGGRVEHHVEATERTNRNRRTANPAGQVKGDVNGAADIGDVGDVEGGCNRWRTVGEVRVRQIVAQDGLGIREDGGTTGVEDVQPPLKGLINFRNTADVVGLTDSKVWLSGWCDGGGRPYPHSSGQDKNHGNGG